MSVYVHHVPGRLRVRTRWVAGCPARARRLSDLIGAEPGVIRVELNHRADSVIIHYDPARLDSGALLSRLREAGMMNGSAPILTANGAVNGAAKPNGAAPRPSIGAGIPVAAGAATLGAMFGKALFDAVLHKGVEHSIRTLVGGGRR